ncbi:uncharacterized protein BDW47DRAFT_101394 [Aspergillus candidus]|uniref:Uncharacterized protein n=1 Tax=Aspergillus candidus TaxID=41067 RepID=A0A2I2FIY6_ASPCN|nr:hypothetical protein BDW47DRAFT_101394 [Aspergillus candidus]PLB40592.1 hypothetical protein BDW47DRAFT_101394 [Aspergillus candidus]
MNSNAGVVQDATKSMKVTVLTTPAGEVDFLCVYTATIPAEFLDRLDAPSQPLDSPCVSVKNFYISLKPARDALQNLHRLICTGSCSLCADAQPTDPGVAK